MTLKDAFQSTPSAWRETSHHVKHPVTDSISIHSLRMEGDLEPLHPILHIIISIHSLRMEGDLCLQATPRPCQAFQSTPSAWRETHTHPGSESAPGYFNPLPPHGGRRTFTVLFFAGQNISIHSLRMEGDLGMIVNFQSGIFISIHSLRMEGDLMRRTVKYAKNQFQSTPSAWRETMYGS